MGCALPEIFLETETYNISFPQWPPVQSGEKSNVQIRYPELSRWLVTVQTKSGRKSFYTKEKELCLTVGKNECFAVTVRPITKSIYRECGCGECNTEFEKNSCKALVEIYEECDFFMPAGIILPMSDKKCLSWEEGFLAEIFMSAADINFPLESFNWKKAEEVIEKKLSADNSVFYNPWFCNREKILENLSEGNFRESFLNASGLVSVSLEEEVLSSFIPENEYIAREKNVSVLRNEKSLFMLDSKLFGTFNYGIVIEWKSKKNMSADFVFMPIYFEENL